jgi:hypothetical protein
MTSLDDKFQNAQDQIIGFLQVNVEPLITEYIAIPLFFEWTFNSQQATTLRALSIFLLLVRQLIKQKIKINKSYSNLIAVAALLAYAALSGNSMAPTFIYAMTYSQDVNESAFLALTTSAVATAYSLNESVAYHIIYILIRNNLRFDITQLVKLQIKPHKTFADRYADIQSMIVSLIHNCCDLAE